jgi:hypothetical protein
MEASPEMKPSSQMTPNVRSFAGKFIFVSGLAGGREVFLGRAIDEPFSDQISIEGKPIAFTPQGYLVIRPFTTVVSFPIKDPNYQIQFITNQDAIEEINNIFRTSINTLSRTNFPLTYRWIESAIRRDGFFNNYTNGTINTFTNRANGFNTNGFGFNNPFNSFFNGFVISAEQFRRALFTSPQVNTTKEMDKITELEGDMTIEIGKITNEIAVKFNHLINRENELTHYFEWIQGFNMPYAPTNQIGGWFYLINRIHIAKHWARRNGKTSLVREFNTLTKEGINRLNETILDHCSSLDTLVTETCTQYGIQFEIYGDMSPFTSYTTPYTGSFENYTFETANAPTTMVGVGV